MTGGAGFIGSHACVDLLKVGYDVVAIDNLCNSSLIAIDRVELLSGRSLAFEQVDVRDANALDYVLARYDVTAVLHFAGCKAVGESVSHPLSYYDTNVAGTVTLLRAMQHHDIRRLVFSSSCSIYGAADHLPIDERAPARPTNPYARSKWFIEQILTDLCRADPSWSVISLRYFNPTGAHPSGLLGEDPSGIPNNVVPYMMQVAAGRLPKLRVFGDDYDTRDGTGVRDYIHVVDVAEGHRRAVAALDHLAGHHMFNLGTGRGTSVLELKQTVEATAGCAIPYEVAPRRPGDVDALVADPTAAHRALGWVARRDVWTMCADAWRFQREHPAGYGKRSGQAMPQAVRQETRGAV